MVENSNHHIPTRSDIFKELAEKKIKGENVVGLKFNPVMEKEMAEEEHKATKLCFIEIMSQLPRITSGEKLH